MAVECRQAEDSDLRIDSSALRAPAEGSIFEAKIQDMLIVISPAKTIDFDCEPHLERATIPAFIPEASVVMKKLRTFSPKRLSKLMDISENLANLNFERNAKWQEEPTAADVRPALLAFQGEVYLGMNARGFSDEDLDYAQKHLRILSGLYGALRPMDMIQAYRLEMGTNLKVGRAKNLYGFWGSKIAAELNQALDGQGDAVLINLASEEYFDAVDSSKLKAKVIKPVFMDAKNGKYKVISFWAKKARGMMTAFALQNRMQEPEGLKAFRGGGYAYSSEMSTADTWVFLRDHQVEPA